MDKFFHIKERNSTVRTEIVGGIVTFFAMAYIIFVNPSYLSQTGMNYHAVLLATCVASALGCFLTAFLANVPFAQAPGMGLNAFFTYTICFGMGYTWQQGLAIVFISGVLFLILTLSPPALKAHCVRPGVFEKRDFRRYRPLYCVYRPFERGHRKAFWRYGRGRRRSPPTTRYGQHPLRTPLLALIGLIITALLLVWKVKGAIFIGIIATTIIGIPMGQTTFAWSPTASRRWAKLS